jgi:hypothetical protein
MSDKIIRLRPSSWLHVLPLRLASSPRSTVGVLRDSSANFVARARRLGCLEKEEVPGAPVGAGGYSFPLAENARGGRTAGWGAAAAAAAAD